MAQVKLNQIEAHGGGGSVVLEYKFSTTTTQADPGAKLFRYNNATPASVTAIYISTTSNTNSDLSTILGAIEVGDIMYIQVQSDSADYIEATVSATTIDNTTWFEIPIAINDSGTLPANNDVCGVLIIKGVSGTQSIREEWIGAGAMIPDESGAIVGSATYAGFDMDIIDMDPVADCHLDFLLSWKQWMTDVNGILTIEVYFEATATAVDFLLTSLQTAISSSIAGGTVTTGTDVVAAAAVGELSMIPVDITIVTPPAVGTNLHINLELLSATTTATTNISIIKARAIPQ